MSDFLIWYALVTLFGFAAWPLLYALLPGLPDRGYTLSRAAGLLGAGFIFWLLASVGVLPNTTGSMLLALVVLFGLALWAYVGTEGLPPLGQWARQHAALVLTAEVLFLAAFALWALVRAGAPDLVGTEKPMEIAFINGIRTSPTFPPRDPWLSGYAISYYYFGYVIIAMLAELSSVVTGVAFNLGVALLFALTALGSYGVVYNLLASERFSQAQAQVGALIAPIFTVMVGNLSAAFDFIRVNAPNLLPSEFWVWLDIQEMTTPAFEAGIPLNEVRFNWYWRASRIIHDRLPTGETSGLQPIDEFPMFSFLLADMHPHVLALPFVLLALALAYNALNQPHPLNRAQFGLYVIAFGGLAFLNTWDLPIYLFVLVAALAVRGLRQRGGLDLAGVLVPIATGVLIVILGLLAYLPWLVSFSSQAGGILPNAVFPTRFQQMAVMFGVFLPFALWFLVAAIREKPHRPDWLSAVLLAVGLLIILISTMLLMGYAAMQIDPLASNFVFTAFGLSGDAATIPNAFAEVIRYRLAHPVTPLVLTAFIGLSLALLLPPVEGFTVGRSEGGLPLAFVGILFLTAFGLIIGPEFLYLRDNFGQRINTIFKFYYAAWVLMGVGAAYAAVWLLGTRRFIGRTLAALLLGVLVFGGMLYPRYGLASRGVDVLRGPEEPPLTLDGLAYVGRNNADEAAALTWITENTSPDAVILEAVGGAYSQHGRVSAITGRPTVMGWANHERQWRGERYPELAGSREGDVREIYATNSIQQALILIERYEVEYIYVGFLERAAEYSTPNSLGKFEQYFTPVFQSEGVTIYRVDPLATEETN